MRKILAIVGGVSFILLLVGQSKSEAIPTFARKYNTSCITCHTAYPKLTAFGEAFRRNGFRFPEDEEEKVKEKPVVLGSPAYKRVFPKAVWPNHIPGLPPVAFQTNGNFTYNPDKTVNTDFKFPKEVNILSAGTIDENISFMMAAHLFEDGGSPALAKAYLVFSDWFRENAFDLVVGQIEPSVLAFPSHRRITLADYALNSYIPGVALGGHVHGGTRFTIGSFQRGMEARGILQDRLAYAAGIVNGNGGGAASEGQFDNNATKDYYYRLEYKLGGLPLTGITGEKKEEEVRIGEAKYWVDDSIKVGTFGYNGKSTTANIRRAGVDVDFFRGNLNLFGAYMVADDTVGYSTWFLQGDLVLNPWLIGALRYEAVDPLSGTAIRRVVPSLTILERANLKTIIEAQYFPDKSGDNLAQVGIDYAF